MYKIMELKDFIVKFANQFDEVEIDDIHPDTEYQNLEEWSSLTVMGLIAMVKTEYNKTITGRDLRSCKTVEELFNVVSKK